MQIAGMGAVHYWEASARPGGPGPVGMEEE